MRIEFRRSESFGPQATSVWTIVFGVVLCACLTAQSSVSVILRDNAGVVACIATLEGARTSDEITVAVRVPGPPALELLQRLPVDQRDFGPLPMRVILLNMVAANSSAPRQLFPHTVDPTLTHPLIDGVSTTAEFSRATFFRSQLIAGSEIVGEKQAVAPTGERITSQTRCKITAADAAQWK